MLGLPEPLDVLNKRLLDHYGYAHPEHQLWRVVWADTSYTEKRHGTFTKYDEHGNYLGEETGVEIRPRYSNIHNKYVLERFMFVPDGVETDLVEPFSYYPMWTFMDKFGQPLPAKWEAIEVIIDNVERAAARAVGAKYKETNEMYTVEQLKRKIAIHEELFGNETKVGDALAYKDGVSLTGKRFE